MTLFMLATAATAFAGSEIPDLKGTWTMKIQAIGHDKLPELQPNRHVDLKNRQSEIDFTLKIDKQDGFRFSGTKASAKRTETISGVIGFDNKTVYMVDDDGILLCRLISPDKMEQIYLHVTEHRSLVGRGMLIRKK
jgi:hypothetical protein